MDDFDCGLLHLPVPASGYKDNNGLSDSKNSKTRNSSKQLELKIEDLERRVQALRTEEPAILRRIIVSLAERACILPEKKDELLREADEAGFSHALTKLLQHVCFGSSAGYEEVEHVFAIACAERSGYAKAMQLISVTSSAQGPAEMTLVDETVHVLEAQLRRDIPLSVVSVAGATRQGKSTLLNFFLRYLANGGWNNENWLDESVPLFGSGFKAGSGIKPITSGIWVWSKVLQIRKGELARQIILMDSEGLFDRLQEEDLMSRIFAFTMVCSSTIVFTTKDLDKQNLNHLTIFTNHMLRVAERTQNLKKEFIIRIKDWQLTSSCDKTAGARAVREALATIQCPEHRAMLERLSASQRDEDGFELVGQPAGIPRIYLTATPDQRFIENCNLFTEGHRAVPPTPAEMGEPCLRSIADLTSAILQLPGLPYLKNLDDSPVTPAQFIELLRSYLAQMKSQEMLPDIADPFCHIFLQTMINAAVLRYRDEMKSLCVVASPSTLLQDRHESCVAGALHVFYSKPSGMSESELQGPVGQIKQECSRALQSFVEHNDALCNEMFLKELRNRVSDYRRETGDLLKGQRGYGDAGLQAMISTVETGVGERIQREQEAFACNDDSVRFREFLSKFRRDIRESNKEIERENREIRSGVIQEIAVAAKKALSEKQSALLQMTRLSFNTETAAYVCEEINGYRNNGTERFLEECAYLIDSSEYKHAKADIESWVEAGVKTLAGAFYAAAKDDALKVANGKLSHLLNAEANTRPDASMLNAKEFCEEVRRGAQKSFASLSKQLKGGDAYASEFANVKNQLSYALLVMIGRAQENSEQSIGTFVNENVGAALQHAEASIAQADSQSAPPSDRQIDDLENRIIEHFVVGLGQSCEALIESSAFKLSKASALFEIYDSMKAFRERCNSRKKEFIETAIEEALQRYEASIRAMADGRTPWLTKRELREVEAQHLDDAKADLKKSTVAYEKDSVYVSLNPLRKLEDDAADYRDNELRLDRAVAKKDVGTTLGLVCATGQGLVGCFAGGGLALAIFSNPVGLAVAAGVGGCMLSYMGFTALAGGREPSEWFEYNRKAASVLLLKGKAVCKKFQKKPAIPEVTLVLAAAINVPGRIVNAHSATRHGSVELGALSNKQIEEALSQGAFLSKIPSNAKRAIFVKLRPENVSATALEQAGSDRPTYETSFNLANSRAAATVSQRLIDDIDAAAITRDADAERPKGFG